MGGEHLKDVGLCLTVSMMTKEERWVHKGKQKDVNGERSKAMCNVLERGF